MTKRESRGFFPRANRPLPSGSRRGGRPAVVVTRAPWRASTRQTRMLWFRATPSTRTRTRWCVRPPFPCSRAR